MRATEEFIVVLNAVSDDTTAAMQACRRKSLDSTFKTIECVGVALVKYVERFIVVVLTNETGAHVNP